MWFYIAAAILAAIYYLTGFANNVYLFIKNFIKKKGRKQK